MAHTGILHIMIGKQPLSDQLIINCLNIDYGIEVAMLTFLPIGADMNASVYKAQTYDQRSYFVKLKHGHQSRTGTKKNAVNLTRVMIC